MSGRAGAGPASAAVELTIDSIAAGGDGVARAEGLVVFVPRTAPGDVVRARVIVEGRLARGHVDELLVPSTLRVEPPCEHYVADRCGGCQIQHLALDAQRGAKRRIVEDALRRIARRDATVDVVRDAGEPWRYRRKLTLALRRRGGAWIAGLHAYDRPGQVFALRDCPITDERVVAAWREVLAAGPHLPSAPALRGAVRLLDDGVAFTLEGGTRWPSAQRFFDAVPSVVALWWVPERGRRRLLLDRRRDAVPGASFVQVNPAVSERLRDDLVRAVLAHGPATAVDAYAGAGDTAVRLAEVGVRVAAIEVDDEAVRYARDRLPAGSVALAGTVEARLDEALPADVVIVNPPRGGLHPRVSELLERAVAAGGPAPRALFYVSCNPATLARDLTRLPSWTLVGATPYDMFPQTAHVETVCELRPNGEP